MGRRLQITRHLGHSRAPRARCPESRWAHGGPSQPSRGAGPRVTDTQPAATPSGLRGSQAGRGGSGVHAARRGAGFKSAEDPRLAPRRGSYCAAPRPLGLCPRRVGAGGAREGAGRGEETRAPGNLPARGRRPRQGRTVLGSADAPRAPCWGWEVARRSHSRGRRRGSAFLKVIQRGRAGPRPRCRPLPSPAPRGARPL